MTEQQYQDINRALIRVAMALAELHDPCYVVGLHRSPGYKNLAAGLEELRRELLASRPKERTE